MRSEISGGLMGRDWALYVFVFVIAAIVLARLDRLGKQLEAVCALIRADVASNEDDRKEIMDDWKQAKKDSTKETRQFWIFWGIVGAAILAWNILAHPG
jgi:hypothetical protein